MQKKKSKKTGEDGLDMEDDEGPNRGAGDVTIEGLSGADSGGEST